ncbi:MAG TPA: hypothetical protein DCR97_04435 [Deltaproteobacteria bacterium]|nr:hypothetical protein [Deltaproteobacteria bacterium]
MSRFRSLLARADRYEDNAPSILSCMNHISAGLSKHFGHECYRWNENEEVRRFESLILSRFLVDYALLTMEEVPEGKRQLYLATTETVFQETLRSIFPWLKVPDIVRKKLEMYSSILSDTSPPTCWQLLAGACTGIDYFSEQNEATLAASSLILPTFLQSAREFWKRYM